MAELAAQEPEKAVELVHVTVEPGREGGGVLPLGRLERADLELKPVAVLVHPPEHAHRVALAEAGVEQLDVAPDPRFDSTARVDELEGEVVGARPGAPPLLSGDRVHALDHAVLLELGDRAHGPSLGAKTDGTLAGMAVVKPFRAVRYDEEVAGPLDQLVAPPYDVIDEAGREELMAEAR